MTMTNDELNLLIASKREPIPEELRSISWTEFQDLQGDESMFISPFHSWKISYDATVFQAPVRRLWKAANFCSDWKLAGELLTELFRSNHLVNFSNGDTDSYDIDIQALHIEVSCDTAQRAVAEAWIAWKERL